MLSSLFISNTAWEAGIPAAGAAASWDTDLTHVRTPMCTHTHGHTHTRRRMHEIPAEPSTRRHQTHGLPLSGSKPPRQMKACVEQKHAQPTQSTRARAGAAGWHTCPAVHMARQGPDTGACTHARTYTGFSPSSAQWLCKRSRCCGTVVGAPLPKVPEQLCCRGAHRQALREGCSRHKSCSMQ